MTLAAWFASWRLRLLFRSSFLLLAVAVVAMAITVLQDEKQRSVDSYQAGIVRTKGQIVARLRHPAGQLALLNPPRRDGSAPPLRVVVLPYSAIDFDDQDKVRHAIEMAGCLVQYPNAGSLCLALANSPWAGGYLYVAGTFGAPPLVAHRIGDETLGAAHRLRIEAVVRGETTRWIAPFEVPVRERAAGDALRGRFTGYIERDGGNYRGARPLRDFRGWVWQDGGCLGADADAGGGDCARRAFFSVRLPIEALRQSLFRERRPAWPPPDIDAFRIHVQVLAPGDAAPLFDSDAAGAVPPFALGDLQPLLLSGETLRIARVGAADDLVVLRGSDPGEGERNSPLILTLIDRLPVARPVAPVTIDDEVATPLGSYRVRVTGDAHSVNRALGIHATRLSWYVGAMLAALALAWLVIEVGIVRRIGRLTARARALSRRVRDDGELADVDLRDLRGGDELGILAGGLDDLLQRVKDDAERARIRARQEQDQWHAVGHEIMSPLQSLLALHGTPDDPSRRYIERMQQAVRVLYGSASPSEAFAASQLAVRPLELKAFLRHVAENAGIDDVVCACPDEAVPVRADEYPLEDVMAHLLSNAARYRQPGTPITLGLQATDSTATITVHNVGPCIAAEDRERIFEYGVSDQPGAGAHGNRGQGLFVARTYMAKMGGTITAHNAPDGVWFAVSLPRVRAGA